MSQQIVGLTSSKDKHVKVINAKGTKTYPVSTVIYCYKKDLPTSLSENHLLYTTDTHELYVGTGKDIKKMQIADNSQEIINITELPDTYVTYDSLQADYATKIITSSLDTRLTKLAEEVTAIQKDIGDVNEALDSKANVSDTWTKESIQANFIDNDEFDAGIKTRVPVQYNSVSINQIVSNDNGIKLTTKNNSTDTVNEVQLSSDGIIITHDALGTTGKKDTQIVIGRNGIYYYKDEPDTITVEKVRSLNTDPTEDENKRLITKGDLLSIVNEAIEAKHYVHENVLSDYATTQYVDSTFARKTP